MLRYVAHGYRQLVGRFHPNWRTNWEFFAVLNGRVAPVFGDRDHPPLQEHMLWVFAPESCHGWIAKPEQKFYRVVLHFGSVPDQLETLVRASGNWLAKKLNRDEVARLKQFAVELQPHFDRPSVISPLLFQGRLMDLSLMMLSGRETQQLPSLPNLAAFKVDSALSWYAEHLPRNPSMKEVADAIHVSPSHLRRLFWQVRASSPKAVFHKVRLEKAQEFMARSSLTLEEVARRSGYANASHLCREFKQARRITPTFWRKRIVVKFLGSSVRAKVG